jgi:uncharacterized protein (DUF305 family)
MTITRALLAAALLSIIGLGAGAQESHSGHGQGATAPSSQAYQKAMDAMHKAMAEPMTGDPDVDFAKGMIPHHQGAIDMARAELQFGKDPELRKLAENIIAAQESEIAFLKAWLSRHKP